MSSDQDLPSSAIQALEECNMNSFQMYISCCASYIHLSITSAECERLFSTLWRLKTYLKATMACQWEYEFVPMNIHYGRQIDIGARKHLWTAPPSL